MLWSPFQPLDFDSTATDLSVLSQATRAGVYVGKLRSNPNKQIARAAAELVTKWKKLVEQEKTSKLHKSKTSASPAPAPASSPAPPSSSGGAKRAFKGDPEKRKFDSDGVDIKRTESTTRNQCIGLVYNGLAYRSTVPESEVIAKAVAVEHAAFSQFKGETPDYKKKIRSLFSNLKTKTNKDLGRRVLTGDISAARFVTMSDEELKSEDQRKKELELEKENMMRAQVPQEQKSISDSLECGRCKKKQVSYTQAQTRAADEPMTTFCECMACGNRWKVCISIPHTAPGDRCINNSSTVLMRELAGAVLPLRWEKKEGLHWIDCAITKKWRGDFGVSRIMGAATITIVSKNEDHGRYVIHIPF